MAHILEAIQNKESTVNANDIIHSQISNLLARMFDYMALNCTEEEKEIIKSWRNELTMIRSTIDRVL